VSMATKGSAAPLVVKDTCRDKSRAT
jgi:hypothetical protein